MNRLKNTLTKMFSNYGEELYNEYDALYYVDLKEKYETFVRDNNLRGVIDIGKIKSEELRTKLTEERNPRESFICHKMVLLFLSEETNARTLKEFAKALAAGDEEKLEYIFEFQDATGMLKNAVLNNFGSQK